MAAKILCLYCGNVFKVFVPNSGEIRYLYCDKCKESKLENFKLLKTEKDKKLDY